ncbi:MAG: FecR family protein [Acidobacteriota bacterium]|nr:FecR family protein [Acidobacteriota bacterium]MDE3264783.1 FecR family protein [Acidobacteriota bacterium]
MSDRNQLNQTLIETAQAIAAERPPADVETAAADRVRQVLAAAAGTDASEAGIDANSTLTSCADYQARMPALVAGTLPEAQRLLVEDHTRECIPCRKHLQAVRAGRAVSDAPGGPAAPARVGRYYAAAAAVVGVAVAGVWLSQRVLLPPQDGIVQVQSVDGRMFVAGDDRGADLVPLGPGDAVDGGDRIRTGAGSRAVLELADGSRVEAAGLTTFRVDARRSGHRVRVDRGSVIVQAAQQENGSLIVSTEEMLVAVKGTIFAVTHGVKGSRVSVIEGEVEVEKGRERHSLLAGDQFRSRPTLVAMTLQEEVGWSQDADRYLAVLEEFKSLRSELNQLMGATPARHSTRLLDLMPADTKIYVAMPNAPATLSDLFELVRSRIESSELLAEWWAEFEASGAVGTIDDVIGVLGELGETMGDETVVALAGGIADNTARPLMVTEVEDAAALREALEGHLEELGDAMGEEGTPVIVEDLDAAEESDGVLLVWIADDLAAASPSLAALRTVAAHRDGAANPFVGSRLHGRLADRYAAGAELLAAVELATVVAELAASEDADGDDGDANGFAFSGLDHVEDLVASRTQDGDRANVTATLSFDGQRSGMVSWLSEPGTNGALDFFSPDASFVAAGVIEDPLTIYDEFLEFLAGLGGEMDGPPAEIESELGMSIRTDFLEHLGGEYAAGIDGPVLPTPAWKAVASVYDAESLQNSIETLALKANERMADGGVGAAITIDEQESGGRTVYRLAVEIEDGDDDGEDSSDGDEDSLEGVLESLVETPEIFYTYFDGYMVSASSVATIDTAIRYRGSGASLTSSQQFLDLLPENGYADFSAVVYNRLAETAGELFDLLPTEVVGDDQQAVVQAIEESITSQGPSLYTVYAGRSEIVVTSSGPSLLAFTGLGPLLGLPNLLQGLDAIDDTAEEPEPEAETGPDVDVVAGLAAGAPSGRNLRPAA